MVIISNCMPYLKYKYCFFFHFDFRSDPEYFAIWAWSGSGSVEKNVGSSSLFFMNRIVHKKRWLHKWLIADFIDTNKASKMHNSKQGVYQRQGKRRLWIPSKIGLLLCKRVNNICITLNEWGGGDYPSIPSYLSIPSHGISATRSQK